MNCGRNPRNGVSKVLIKLTPLSEATYLSLEKLSRMRCDEYNTFEQTRIQGRFGLWGLRVREYLASVPPAWGWKQSRKRTIEKQKYVWWHAHIHMSPTSKLPVLWLGIYLLIWATSVMVYPHSHGLERDHPLEALNAPSCTNEWGQ